VSLPTCVGVAHTSQLTWLGHLLVIVCEHALSACTVLNQKQLCLMMIVDGLQRQLSTSWASDPDADRSSTTDDAQSSLLSSRSPRWQTQDSQPRGNFFADGHDDNDLPQSDEFLPEPSLREGIGEGFRHGVTEDFRDASGMSNGHRST